MTINYREKAMDYLALNLAHENMGIYPQKITGGEHAYEQRTEKMEGWNDYSMKLSKKWSEISDWLDKIPSESKATIEDLLLDDKISLSIGKSISMYVSCNDVFFWGCSDGEEITLEEIPSLIKACQECPEAGTELWCARKTQQRPQGASYSYYKPEHWHLFDACGPERETGFGNPYKPGAYNRTGGNVE